MPELPDLDILADAFHAALAGRPDRQAPACPSRSSCAGTAGRARGARRAGAAIASRNGASSWCSSCERDRLDDQPDAHRPAGARAHPARRRSPRRRSCSRFGRTRRAAAGRRRDWTRGAGLAAAGLTRRWSCAIGTPRGWARSTCCPQGVMRPVAGWDEQGPDVDDPALDLADVARAGSRRHTGELKNLLKNQAFVAGIGNGYSDEILWAAGLAPVPQALDARAPRRSTACAHAAREVPAWAIDGAPAARATEVRDRGPRLPARPPQGWPALSALRDDHHRDLPGRIRHLLVPLLPGLTATSPHQPLSGHQDDDRRPPGAVDHRGRSTGRSCRTLTPNRSAMVRNVSPSRTR